MRVGYVLGILVIVCTVYMVGTTVLERCETLASQVSTGTCSDQNSYTATEGESISEDEERTSTTPTFTVGESQIIDTENIGKPTENPDSPIF